MQEKSGNEATLVSWAWRKRQGSCLSNSWAYDVRHGALGVSETSHSSDMRSIGGFASVLPLLGEWGSEPTASQVESSSFVAPDASAPYFLNLPTQPAQTCS